MIIDIGRPNLLNEEDWERELKIIKFVDDHPDIVGTQAMNIIEDYCKRKIQFFGQGYKYEFNCTTKKATKEFDEFLKECFFDFNN